MIEWITDILFTALIAIVIFVVVASVVFFLYDTIATLWTGES